MLTRRTRLICPGRFPGQSDIAGDKAPARAGTRCRRSRPYPPVVQLKDWQRGIADSGRRDPRHPPPPPCQFPPGRAGGFRPPGGTVRPCLPAAAIRDNRPPPVLRSLSAPTGAPSAGAARTPPPSRASARSGLSRRGHDTRCCVVGAVLCALHPDRGQGLPRVYAPPERSPDRASRYELTGNSLPSGARRLVRSFNLLTLAFSAPSVPLATCLVRPYPCKTRIGNPHPYGNMAIPLA